MNKQSGCTFFIGFEGMDACYKETNAAFLFNYLKDIYFKEYIDEGKLNIHLVSFPNYDSESSYFVKQYLGDKYDNLLKSYGDYRANGFSFDLITNFYLLDMVDTLNKIDTTKPTIIIFDRYFYSQMYYLTKNIHKCYTEKLYDDYTIKICIDKIIEKANEYKLPKLNFLYKMYNDEETMLDTIKKRSEEKGTPLDKYESDVEYLKSVRNVFMGDHFINKSLLNNITGNIDILYNISVTRKSREQVADDVKTAIHNTLIEYKRILDIYYKGGTENV